MKKTLINKFKNRSAKVAVIGLGYVGLPLATVLAEAGLNVVGVDSNQKKINSLNQGESYISDVPSSQIAHLITSERLRGTTEYDVVKDVDAVSICVPTPLRKTKDPDLSYILDAIEQLGKYVHPGMVIVLESTTYPGTTRELLLPKLIDGNELEIGKDFFLAFSPERIDPGREDWTTKNTPKIVGGITESCTEVATAFYETALDRVIPVSSSEVAELSKLLENTFRMVNIGLANEMALMCDKLGINVWEVIDAAATKPFGFMKFTPGPGIGGHCVPLDPHYLSWKMRGLNYTARFIELASQINADMPVFVVRKVQDLLNEHNKSLKGSKVLILGVAYKPDIDDFRESPALDVIGLLMEKGCRVSYHDPFVPQLEHDGWQLESVQNLIEEVQKADCVVIVTNHSQYDFSSILIEARLILDSRNALGENGLNNPKVVRM